MTVARGFYGSYRTARAGIIFFTEDGIVVRCTSSTTQIVLDNLRNILGSEVQRSFKSYSANLTSILGLTVYKVDREKDTV